MVKEEEIIIGKAFLGQRLVYDKGFTLERKDAQ